MPIYEYVCSRCNHRTDILHGINDPGPAFCPSCGAEGTMRKAFAPPAIHFKGSGWAKKERATASRSKAGGSTESGGGDKSEASGDKGSKADTPAAATSDKGGD
ncbi:MAG TPA: zinc ribbon domain-containing protein [Candidatus Limnocylindrales bacterium]|jgi:putative FmdB family regulatory protein